MTKPVDPAAAVTDLRERLSDETNAAYSDAALRDILRRAAYDMGIQDRQAHPDMLPAITAAAGEAIAREAGIDTDWQEGPLSAALTESVFFRSVTGGPGLRVPAGTAVTLRETRQGGLVATYRDGWNLYRAAVTVTDIEPNY